MKSSAPHGGAGPAPAADITWCDTMKGRAGTPVLGKDFMLSCASNRDSQKVGRTEGPARPKAPDKVGIRDEAIPGESFITLSPAPLRHGSVADQ